MRRLLPAAVVLGLALSSTMAHPHDFSQIDCTTPLFLSGFIEMVNEASSRLKNAGGQIIDITDASLVTRISTRVLCRGVFHYSDDSTGSMFFGLHDNSLGDVVWETRGAK